MNQTVPEPTPDARSSLVAARQDVDAAMSGDAARRQRDSPEAIADDGGVGLVLV